MAHQRQLTDYFINSPSPNLSMPQHTGLNPPTPASPRPVNTQIQNEIPPALLKTIKDISTKYAALFCKISNISQKINDFQRHKNDGTIPQQLTFKYKKLFTKDHESNLRSTMITADIDNNIANFQSKVNELNILYDQKLQDLEQTVSEPLRKCNFNITTSLVLERFHSELYNRQLEFLLKQNKDKISKQNKRNEFLNRQEQANQIATLSNRQISTLLNEMKDLKIQIKQIKRSKQQPKSKSIHTDKSMNSKPKNRSKNGKRGQITSTGGKKKNNGKKSSSSKNN